MEIAILIVEWERMLLEHLMLRLKAQNWHILKSRQHNGIKRILKKHPIDVVLLNLNDLKKEGMALIKMIKKNTPLFN
jgi:DNA-binding response OmpR family regulator